MPTALLIYNIYIIRNGSHEIPKKCFQRKTYEPAHKISVLILLVSCGGTDEPANTLF